MSSNYYKFQRENELFFNNLNLHESVSPKKYLDTLFSGVLEEKNNNGEMVSRRTYVAGYLYGSYIYEDSFERVYGSMCFEYYNGYLLRYYKNTNSVSFEVYDMGFPLESVYNDKGKTIEARKIEVNKVFQDENIIDFNSIIEDMEKTYDITIDDTDSILGWALSNYVTNEKSIEDLQKGIWKIYRKDKMDKGLYNDDFLKFYSEQEKLKNRIIKEDQFENKVKLIAGVDVAYNEMEQTMVGAIVVLNIDTLEVIEQAHHKMNITFPYVPGLFSFREVPPIIEAFNKLKVKPDLIICDAQGVAHPKNVGMATHLGIQLNIPTIGCAKKRLVGYYDKEKLGNKRGDRQSLIWNSEEVGVALITQDDIKPMFVSIGHKINLETAVDWVLKLTPKYRLPETTRQADQLVNKIIKNRTEFDFLNDNDSE